MMTKRFEPIKGKTADIIETVMTSPDTPQTDDMQFKIRLAVEEAVENIVLYAYDDGEGWMSISTETEGDSLVITMCDGGTPFNPLEQDDPDITLSADERQIGGLGIFLCKQLMDEVTYNYKDNQNILKFKIKKQ